MGQNPIIFLDIYGLKSSGLLSSILKFLTKKFSNVGGEGARLSREQFLVRLWERSVQLISVN